MLGWGLGILFACIPLSITIMLVLATYIYLHKKDKHANIFFIGLAFEMIVYVIYSFIFRYAIFDFYSILILSLVVIIPVISVITSKIMFHKESNMFMIIFSIFQIIAITIYYTFVVCKMPLTEFY